jgi:hypothetical protein
MMETIREGGARFQSLPNRNDNPPLASLIMTVSAGTWSRGVIAKISTATQLSCPSIAFVITSRRVHCLDLPGPPAARCFPSLGCSLPG